jgi:ribose/xylose/arabinose/galactoside ABC-type transport system permease subunit
MENLISFSIESVVVQLRDLMNTLTFWQMIVAGLIVIFVVHFLMGNSQVRHKH